jgi:hypothetical protein
MLYSKVTHELRITGLPAECFAVVSDFAFWYTWNSNILHVSLDGPFEQGAQGVAIPTLYRITPIRVSSVSENEFIQVDYTIPLGVVRATYEFKSVSLSETKVKVSTEIRSFYGWFIFLYKRARYRENLIQSLEKLQKRLSDLKSNKTN